MIAEIGSLKKNKTRRKRIVVENREMTDVENTLSLFSLLEANLKYPVSMP